MFKKLLPLLFLFAGFQVNAALIANWSFDEGTGGVAVDSSGSLLNHDLTLVGGYSWNTSGKFGNALNTPIGSYGVMNIDNIDIGSNWTISGWFKDYHLTGDWNTLTRGTADHQILGEAGSEILGAYDNYSGSAMHGNDNNFAMTSLASSVWHNIVAVGAGGDTDYYINGLLVGTSNFQSLTDVHWIGGLGSGQTFAGSIDDVGLWDEALSSADILTLQSIEANNIHAVPEPSLIVLFGLGLVGIGLARRRQS
ncbi:PEP-CTERM sorting domain-containing protein [Colwellia sp. MB3u-70]|uniref:LamG-like jellyroll fold domain-containing protein n=1 Tax=unclassified Colwellia TaxID=196834 RepID=UPI0015F3B7B7|nr:MULTISPECIES: LamG-like jellyroll fold domain-containing protein [unclassified Colwellia]MBA6291681.1 PEP-CTERM sorting domain-containing protein [Colwellia sp. MB3u-8]MBA6305660.1 PEP-CTERM sorting domain-containing protein [Colwellia sp. MB3u-70]